MGQTLFEQHFPLLPRPQQVSVRSGQGIRFQDLTTITADDSLIRALPLVMSHLPISPEARRGSVVVRVRHGSDLPPQGYTLEVRDSIVSVEGVDGAGAFYGLQTLAQLMQDAREQNIEIPPLVITDHPEISYRAVHLDLKHHLDAGRYYYDMMDRLAGIKVNAVIIEFEDKLRYRRAPGVAAPQAISIEEFAALSRYARERHIEISPLVQGLGHASYILKHPAFHSLRDDPSSDWVFDPLNPKTYDLQFALYEDALEATPYGRFLHVGGDEVGKLGQSELAKASGKSPLELQLHWLQKVSAFAKEHGRIPIFWDDMVFKLAGLYETTYDDKLESEEVFLRWEKNQKLLDQNVGLFPANCVYMRWNYETPKIPGNIAAIEWYKRNGLHVMAATSAQLYSSMFPRTSVQFQPIKDFCMLTSSHQLDGILCTVWDDTSPHLETLTRGVHDFSFFSWNYEDINENEARRTYRHRFYGARLHDAKDFQDILEKQTTPFWETAFLVSGDREIFHRSFTLINLPDPARPGAWSQQHAIRINRAKEVRQLHSELSDLLTDASTAATRNQYALRLFRAINDLQQYSSDVLLLLQRYDQAKSRERQAIADHIAATVAAFPRLRRSFENTYAETRIMGNPQDYVLDSNFHEHLANATNTTDWMFMYELPMNDRITQWLHANSRHGNEPKTTKHRSKQRENR